MGRRGPAAKPDALKRLEGDPGKRGLNGAAVEAGGSPVAPDHVAGYAQAVWERILGAMPPGLYSACDSDLLAAYCVAAALHARAAQAIAAQGEMCVSDTGAAYQSPWMAVVNRQAALLATLGTRLGLDPAARSSLRRPPASDAQGSKFAGLVSLPGGRNG